MSDYFQFDYSIAFFCLIFFIHENKSWSQEPCRNPLLKTDSSATDDLGTCFHITWLLKCTGFSQRSEKVTSFVTGCFSQFKLTMGSGKQPGLETNQQDSNTSCIPTSFLSTLQLKFALDGHYVVICNISHGTRQFMECTEYIAHSYLQSFLFLWNYIGTVERGQTVSVSWHKKNPAKINLVDSHLKFWLCTCDTSPFVSVIIYWLLRFFMSFAVLFLSPFGLVFSAAPSIHESQH